MPNPISLTLKGVTATRSIIPALPKLAEEKFFNFFRGSAADAINRSYGKGLEASLIGSGPVYFEHYARFTPYTGALKLSLAHEFTGLTFMAVWRPVAGGTGASWRIFSCDPVTIPTVGFSMLASGSPRLMQLNGTSPTTGTANLAFPDGEPWQFVVATIGGAGPTLIENFTMGTASTDGPAVASLLSAPGSFFTLASGPSGGPTKPSDFAWASLVTRRLTSPEKLAYYAAMKPLLLRQAKQTILI